MEKAEDLREIEGIRAALAESPEFEALKDTATRRHQLYQFIAENPDPLWREIGQQLRDGQLRPSEMLSIPQYREHLRTGIADGLTHFTEMVGALDDHLRSGGEVVGAGADRGSGADLSDVEDLSESLGPILRRR